MYMAFSSFVRLVSIWSYEMNRGKEVNSIFRKPVIVDFKVRGQNKSDARR